MNNTTTRNRTQIAAPIDLTERAVPLTLDDLLRDDRVIVDVWAHEPIDDEAALDEAYEGEQDEPEVVLMGNEAAVVLHTADVDGTLALVEACLRRGWGREGVLPEGVDVERYDGLRPDLADPVAGVFAQSLREPFASWRLIEAVRA